MTDTTKTTDAGAPALTSPHLNQSAILHSEMQGKLVDTDRAIIVLKTEIEGRERAKDEAIAEINAKHDTFKAGAVTQVADLERVKLAISAAIDVLAPSEAPIEADEDATKQLAPVDQQSQAA